MSHVLDDWLCKHPWQMVCCLLYLHCFVYDIFFSEFCTYSEFMLLFQVIPHRPEKFKGQFDFGTMGVKEKRSMIFTLRNDNPIDVSLQL